MLRYFHIDEGEAALVDKDHANDHDNPFPPW